MLMQTYVAETEAEARADAEPHATWYHRLFQDVLPGAPGKEVQPGYELYDTVRKKHAEVDYEDLARWGSAFGTPEQVAARILDYAAHAGVNHWMAEMKFGGISHRQTMRSMELFAKEVIPRMRAGRAPVPARASRRDEHPQTR